MTFLIIAPYKYAYSLTYLLTYLLSFDGYYHIISATVFLITVAVNYLTHS